MPASQGDGPAKRRDPLGEKPARGRRAGFEARLPGEALPDQHDTAIIEGGIAVAFYNCGIERQRRGELKACVADYTEAIRLDPKLVLAWNNRGVARQELGDLEGALSDYDEALRIDPRLALAWNNRGLAKRAKGDLRGAIADYDRALMIDPRYVGAWNNRGIARRQQGDSDGAIEDFDEALQIDSANAHVWCGRAYAEYGRSRWDEALANFIKARRCGLPAVQDAAAALRIWLLRTKAGADGAATEELRSLARGWAPGGPLDWQRRVAAFLAGEVAEAAFLDQAKDSSESLCEACFFAGAKRQAAGDAAGAKKLFQRSVETGATHLAAHAHSAAGITELSKK